MEYTLWCETFGKRRLDHITARLNSVIGRGCITVQHFFVLCSREIWTPRLVRIVDQQQNTCAGLVGQRLGKCQVFMPIGWKYIPSDLEGDGNVLWHGLCEVLSKFVILTLWEAASFLSGSAQQFAPEMLFVPVNYLLFLCFLKSVTCLRSCNVTGSPNTWLTKCSLPFFYDM